MERDVVERLEEWDAHAKDHGVDHKLVREAAAEIRRLRWALDQAIQGEEVAAEERDRLRSLLEGGIQGCVWSVEGMGRVGFYAERQGDLPQRNMKGDPAVLLLLPRDTEASDGER